MLPVSENNLNKKYFTEEDSPVPLIPTDLAWENMLGKLNNEDKRKRRMFLWMPPIGCAIFVLLLLAGGMVIWFTNKQVISQPVKPTDTLLALKHAVGDNNRNAIRTNKNNMELTEENLAQMETIQALPEAFVKPAQQASSENPASNFNNKIGKLPEPYKRNRHRGYNVGKRNVAANWNNENIKSDSNRTLPFAFPHITDLTEAIAVSANKPLPVVSLPEKKSPDSIPEDRFTVSAGVQWQAQIPFTGMENYIKGPDGGNALYRLLIPGIWLSIGKNRQQVTFTCMSLASAVMPAKDYETGYAPANDSMPVMAHKRMVNTFGLQSGLSWNYQVNSHWSIGAGAQANWWKKGLVLAKPVDDSLGIKPFLYTVNSQQEEKFTSFQLSVVLETGFRLKAWEGILQLSQPLHTTVKGLPAQVSLRAGIRYRLFRKNFK